MPPEELSRGSGEGLENMKTMSPSEYLIMSLRRCRESAGMTQEQWGSSIGYSAQHVSAIERGSRAALPDYLTRVDGRYGTTLTHFYTNFLLGETAPVWLREWIEIEREAVMLRWFEPSMIPGLLQTEAYARAILSWGGLSTAVEIEQRLASRMERQAVLRREPTPPLAFFLLDEQALRRDFGDAAMMREQCERLLEAAQLPHVHLQVIPSGAGLHAGLAGAFILARSPDGAEAAHTDAALEAGITDHPEKVAALHARWDAIRSEALPHSAAVKMIKEVAETWT
ncbi:helix-turn-helix transcriptional regulator [Solwaraspora sp. WMMD406]|uniref:helix-turn-helix domain-containing protein n=1 Tax=Solwaraspora sp. WMMD406 TaxID=3016095 RepID=UPI0024166EA7|nr:helix-turn-helix transcriptional regulator [Solwaraspora sp. WMMD406]MDG4765767.1 helix-turn-helix transcriptional regulator [Solwaraspora sp. WMMD406]